MICCATVYPIEVCVLSVATISTPRYGVASTIVMLWLGIICESERNPNNLGSSSGMRSMMYGMSIEA